MNKRKKKKMVTKKPSTKDCMKFYRNKVNKLQNINGVYINRNNRLFNKTTELACEIIQLKRENSLLADKNAQLVKKGAGIEKEINELYETRRNQQKQIEQQEGQIALLKYRSDKYKAQFEECQKPLWKKVLRK